MLSSLRSNWFSFSPDARRHLINAALFGLTLDGGVNAVILNLYFLRLGLGPAFVGIAGAVGMLVFAFASLPFGRLGDRFGLRRVMTAGAALSAVGTLLLLLVDSLPQALLTTGLISCVALVNLGLAAYYANAAPYLAGTAGVANRTRAFAAQSALFALAGFIGSLIGGGLPQLFATLLGRPLSDALPYRLTLIVVPFVIASVVWSLRGMREPGPDTLDEPSPAELTQNAPQPARPLEPFLTTRAALLLIGFFASMRFLQVGGVGAGTTFFNVFMDRQFGVPTAVIGGFQAAAKLIGIPVALITPALIKRFGQIQVTLAALVLTVLTMLPLAFAPNWWVAGLATWGCGSSRRRAMPRSPCSASSARRRVCAAR
jgi:MFS family permease